MQYSSVRSATTILLLAAVSVSCSKTLSRDEAAALITNHPDFNAPITAKVHVGAGESSEINVDRSFAALGLLDLEYGQATAGGLSAGTFPITKLTPKGETASREWKLIQDRGTGYLGLVDRTWLVPVANRAFGEVTGIADEPGRSEASVKFNYRFVENSSVGKFDRIDYSASKEGLAVMKRYDDGWRVERLEGLGPMVLR